VFVRCVKALPTVFLKSQFEFSRGNYEKAVRMLSSTAPHVLNPAASVRGSLRNATAMYFNNLGVAHFHLRKHNLGTFYLRRAAEENMKSVQEAHNQDGTLAFVLNQQSVNERCDQSKNLDIYLDCDDLFSSELRRRHSLLSKGVVLSLTSYAFCIFLFLFLLTLTAQQRLDGF